MAREVIALLLAGVLLVAGGAKLFDPAGTRRSVRELGLPTALCWPVAITLPLIELALAAGLVVEATSRAAASAAACLLTVFAVVIGINAARGRSIDCGCFGPLHSSKTGYSTVARNAGLAVLAVVVAVTPAAPISWPDVAGAIVVAALAAQAALWVVLLRRYGRALRRVDELEAVGGRRDRLAVGNRAPQFALPSVADGSVSLGELLASARPLLLLFFDPGCGPCHALLPKVSDWQHALAGQLTVVLVGNGDRDGITAVASEYALRNVLLDLNRDVAELYGSWSTPSAVLITADARIERVSVAGAEAIEQIVQPYVEAPSRLPIGGASRRAIAAGVAGAVTMAAASAQAASHASSETTDPELQAIDTALTAAGPRLVAAAKKSASAVRLQATLVGKGLRAKQVAARRALAAERREVLKLRASVAKLSATSSDAQAVKMIVDNSLALLARSLEKRARAIGAPPKVAARLIEEAQKLFLDSVGVGMTAAQRLGHP